MRTLSCTSHCPLLIIAVDQEGMWKWRGRRGKGREDGWRDAKKVVVFVFTFAGMFQRAKKKYKGLVVNGGEICRD